MKKYIFTLLVLSVFVTGCAGMAKISQSRIRESLLTEIAEPASRFTVGEKFTFIAAWKGIHVGTATATVSELTDYKGYEVYKIVVVAKTTEFLSKLFRVEDTFVSYMDKDKLISRGFEATIREGRYKKDLVVDYDLEKNIAIYKNLKDGTVKTCPVEENVQDPISAAYFLRAAPLKAGDSVQVTVNLNEKNYEIFANIEKRSCITIPGMDTFDAFLVRPYVKLEGKRQKKGTAWGYLSSDNRRIALYMVVRVLEIPWIGNVTATLAKIEYTEE